MTTEKNCKEGLSLSVEKHLQCYFDAHKGNFPSSGLYKRVLAEIERPLITLTLITTKGNCIKASEILGINRNTLNKKIKELKIKVPRGKADI